MSTVKVGGRPSTEVSGGPKIEDIKSTNGALHVLDTAVNTAASKTALTASGAVKSSSGYLYGYEVTTALSAAAITIYDNTAGSGTAVMVIPASSAAGTSKNLVSPIKCDTGIYASFGGTGTVLFLYT